MFNEIVKDINQRIADQPDSRCASEDEVRICWLVIEVQYLREKINTAKNCLVCAAITPSIEVIQNTLEILNHDN